MPMVKSTVKNTITPRTVSFTRGNVVSGRDGVTENQMVRSDGVSS